MVRLQVCEIFAPLDFFPIINKGIFKLLLWMKINFWFQKNLYHSKKLIFLISVYSVWWKA